MEIELQFNTIAPGGPGSRPTWTSSAKDMVMTALGTSRVWVTLGYGILNEVYWPATGQPQIRDLGFIVAGPSGWFEVKRVNRYQISMPEDCVPLPQVTHQGDRYRLVIEVVPDPSRDVVLISYRLTGDDVKLYALLAPHLGNSGEHNNARAAAEDGLEGDHRTVPIERLRLFEIERRIRGNVRRVARFFQERANDVGIWRGH